MDTTTWPRHPRCARCVRLRVALAGGLLVLVSSLALRAASAPTAASAPASAPAAFASASAAQPVPIAVLGVVAPASAASSAADMRLVYKTVALPSGRRGEPYGPRQVVQGGTPPYRYTLDGKLPPGLVLAEDGRLAGVPAENGSFHFLLGVQDASVPARVAQQVYVLNVVTPVRKPAAAASAASAPAVPPSLTALNVADAEATANPDAGLPTSYKLTPADQAMLLQEPAGTGQELVPADNVPTAAASAPMTAASAVPPVVPSTEQFAAMLLPLTDVEYPTRALFVDALEQGRCGYYQVHVKEIAAKQGVAVDDACPPAPLAAPTAAAARKAAAAGTMSLRRFYDELLPPALRDEVVKKAEKRHRFEEARPLRLTGSGCGCTPIRTSNEVIGFVPFWIAGDAPLPVDFSLMTRLGYMGVVLADDGDWLEPPGWNSHAGGFAREARRHGTRMDLVLYRRDWGSLLAKPRAQQDAVAKKAADKAVELAQVQHDDLQSHLENLLLPGWRDSPYVYDGITVFFEDSPTAGAQQAAFASFLDTFLHSLVKAMQKTKERAYQINIVVPGTLLGDSGAYTYDGLMDVLESAEPKRDSKGVEQAAKQGYSGTTDLTVDFLVLLSAPSDRSTLALRAGIDATPNLDGHRRIAFLESVVPVEFHQRGEKPAILVPKAADQLDRDLAYIKWNFGGVGLWPVPTDGSGTGTDVHKWVSHNYAVNGGTLATLCDFACPNRVPLRLLFEAIVLAELAGIVLYAWNCRVRRLGKRYLLMLWGGALATLAVAFVVFSCDPALHRWRDENYLLYGLILFLFAAGLYVTFKPRVEAP